jgi:hypothetical protein
LIIPIDLKPLKATMPTTTPTILDQISAEKTKISERLARLHTDRAATATRLTDLETAERVLTRRWQDAACQENHTDCRRGSKGHNCEPRPRAAAKSSHEQVSGTQTQRTEPGRTRPGTGYGQDPAGTLQGVAPTIGQTMSASQCSAISAPVGSRSVTASYMRHRPQPSSARDSLGWNPVA